MELNITNSRHEGERHTGPLFPDAAERVCAYQSESIHLSASIQAHSPENRDGKLNRDLPKPPPYSEYELFITRHTGKAIEFKLVAKRTDIVPQRIAEGRAVESDVLLVTLDFAELCNRIFGPGAMVFHETEAFPESVREAMKHAYPR